MNSEQKRKTAKATSQSRRNLLAGLGAGMTLSLLRSGHARASALPTCVARPEQTAGPYFLDERLERADIRSDPADGRVPDGQLFELAFFVSRISGEMCEPLAGAIVDVWQCDAKGVYSGFRDFNDQFDTRGSAFLRGYQRTDHQGIARFTTIFPGWYPGRAVHIHYRVVAESESGAQHQHTSQLYFQESAIATVFKQAPYAGRDSEWPNNASDGIFRRGGDELIVPIVHEGNRLVGEHHLGLDLA